MQPLKVVVITPTTGLCRMGYAQSLARLVMHFSQVQVFEGVENQWLTVDSIEGSGIGANYHAMIKKYLADRETKWTHFLSLEDDMGLDPRINGSTLFISQTSASLAIADPGRSWWRRCSPAAVAASMTSLHSSFVIGR